MDFGGDILKALRRALSFIEYIGGINMDKKLRIGIIGCGGIAEKKHLPALSALPELCEMVAFCDIDKEMSLRILLRDRKSVV